MNQSQRIQHAIKLSGVKKTAIAEKCRVSGATVSQWASGDTKTLKAENVFPLADITGYSARWIATGEGPEKLESMQLQAESSSTSRSQVKNVQDVDLDLLQQIIDGQAELRAEFKAAILEMRTQRKADSKPAVAAKKR